VDDKNPTGLGIGATVEVEEVLDEDVVRGVFTNWGDIPRIILKYFHDDSARMMWKELGQAII
jgi:hypothetical protein